MPNKWWRGDRPAGCLIRDSDGVTKGESKVRCNGVLGESVLYRMIQEVVIYGVQLRTANMRGEGRARGGTRGLVMKACSQAPGKSWCTDMQASNLG